MAALLESDGKENENSKKNKLLEYLKEIEKLTEDENGDYTINIVTGNEGCDMDSMVSALTWAYYKHSTRKDQNSYWIPLLNIPQEDLQLRKDAMWSFEQIDSTLINYFWFRDNKKLMTWLPQDNKIIEINLVDHNKLSPFNYYYIPYNESNFQNKITGILDHHEDAGLYKETCKDEFRIIRSQGSCTIIVYQTIEKLSKKHKHFKIPNELKQLILATILLDTKNMKNASKDDEEVYNELLKKKLIPDEFKDKKEKDSTKAWYKYLNALKENYENFNYNQIVKKDLKHDLFDDILVGISTVKESVQESYQNNEQFIQIISLIHSKVFFIKAPSNNKQDNFKQLLMLCKIDNNDGIKLYKYLIETMPTYDELGLISTSFIDKYQENGETNIAEDVKVMYQFWKLNSDVSRKTFEPILVKVFNNYK